MALSSKLGTSLFRYRSLLEPDAFRLISLKPAPSATSQVECSLLHSTLSACDREIIDHYTALSYVWGDANQTRQILIDGYAMVITATLEAALRDLRDETRIVRVWADALCIDQSNIEERNQQVKQMGRIYSTAHHTVIYLGELTGPVEKVLQATPSQSSGVWITLDKKRLNEVIEAAEDGLLTRPWFSRVWVFQELVLSRDPWVQCGRLRVRWTDLCDVLISNKSNGAGVELLREMHFARTRRVQTDLFHLLLSRRGLGATDTRDMVFAHLGVASDGAAIQGHVKIDYRQNVERLYEDVARYFIETAGPGTVLSQAANDANHNPHLASWAPDWTVRSSTLLPMYRDNRMNVVHLKPEPHYAFISEDGDDNRAPILAHIGYQVETIHSISPAIHAPSQQDSRQRTGYQTAVDELHALYASVGGSYASGDDNGQYTHMPLDRGNLRPRHRELHLRLGREWLDLLDQKDLLLLSVLTLQQQSPAATIPSEEPLASSHAEFRTGFEEWLTARAAKGIIAVGGDSEGMESLMYTHLHPNAPPSVLSGRRLAYMQSGRVGVVPIQARKGDMVVYLAGLPISVVLRSAAAADGGEGRKKKEGEKNEEGEEKKIYEALGGKRQEIVKSKSVYVKQFLELVSGERGESSVRHVTLVGECYVEGVIGWSFKERKEKHDFEIFALH